MIKTVNKRITAFAIILLLFCATALPILADDGGVQAPPVPAPTTAADEVIENITAIGSASISKQSNFELKQVSILAGDEDKIVTFTVTANNGGDKDLEFIDYWVRLKNKAGAQFTVNLIPDDKDKNRIPPHSSVDFHFYAKVNTATNLKDLSFSFIQWDFAAANYEKKLGEIALPESYTDLTPVNVKRIVPVAGTTLKTAVTRVVINKNDENFLVSVQFAMENTGLKSVKLPSFAYAIHTSEGLIYPLDAPAAKDLTIAPRMKKELQMSSTIPISVLPNDWKLVVTKEDPALKTLPVAFYALPPSTDDSASGVSESARVIDIAGTPVSTGINRASMGKTDKNYLANIFFSFANTGVKAVQIPNYLFAVKTGEGLTYPLAASGFKDISLNPKESKEIQLSVSIPLSVKVDALELQLIQPSPSGADSSFNYPVASYKVAKLTAQELSVGTEYPFTDKTGTYTVKLNAIQRLPWEDQDIISAEISLGNKGTTPTALPSGLQGYFLLDGNVKVEASLIKMDSIISLAAKSSTSYILMSKVPYSSQFTDLKLVLQEKASDTDMTTIAEFKHNSDLMTIPAIAKGESYLLVNVGKASELKITNVYTYKGATTDLYYMEMDMKNLEKRFTGASKLAAYLKTQDDMYFPATVSNVTQKISPSGKAVLAVWGELPKGLKSDNLDLMIGLAVPTAAAAPSAGSSVTEETNADGYVRVAQMKLPDENTTVQSSTGSLVIQPYTIGLSNIKPSGVSASSFSFNFDYTLAKNTEPSPDPTTNVHKLVIEVTDSLSHKYEGKFDLDQGAGSTTGLAIGSGSLSFPVSFSNLNKGIEFINSISQSRTYSLKIYDEYKGFRRLISSTSGSWF